MLKPYIGASVHYIPMNDEELRCSKCEHDAPRAAVITRVHSDLDVDLLIFTTKKETPTQVRHVVPYATKAYAPHWRWINTTMLEETAADPEELAEIAQTVYAPLRRVEKSPLTPEVVEAGRVHPTEVAKAPPEVEEVDEMYVALPLQGALRALIPGRGIRDRLLLERWAKALEGHLVDTSVMFDVDEKGKMRVGVTTEEGTVLEDDNIPARTPLIPEDQPRIFPEGFGEKGEDSETTRQGEQT